MARAVSNILETKIAFDVNQPPDLRAARHEIGGQGIAPGRYRVRRISGILPPGVSKSIGRGRGRTLLLGIPIASFDVRDHRLVYHFWPVVDEIESIDGQLVGRGRLFGRVTFCHFRLERLPSVGTDPQVTRP